MNRQQFAVWVSLISIIIGIVGTLFFFDSVIGLSFPIFTVLMIAAVVGSGWRANRPMNRRNLGVFIPTLFFAAMVAVRSDVNLTVINVGAVMTLFALALFYIGNDRFFDLSGLGAHSAAFIESGIRISIIEPIVNFTELSKWIGNQEGGNRAMPIIRGLALAIPIVLVFAALLSSADLVFEGYLDQIWSMVVQPEAVIGRVIFTGFLAWLSMGAIVLGVARSWRSPKEDEVLEPEGPEVVEDIQNGNLEASDLDDLFTPDDQPTPPKRTSAPFRLGAIESSMVLGSVNLLFAAFVLIQFVYLFSGQSAIESGAYSYSQYARRGFMELVSVAVLTMFLLVVMDSISVREGKSENSLFRGLSLGIIGLSCIILVSAARRMGLYVDEFGYTRLRLWVNIFMPWAGLLFLFMAAGQFRLRRNIITLGLVVITIGHLATVNLINVDARVANSNIDRYLEDGQEIDLCYLNKLSVDAAPALVRLYNLVEDEAIKTATGNLLARHLNEIERVYAFNNPVFAFHFGRQRAFNAITSIDSEIENYTATPPYYDYYSREGCYFER